VEERVNEAPKKIWLQTGCEDAGCNGECSFSELGEVTWCEDQIHKDDIAYIRADLLDGLVEALEGLLSCQDDPVEIMEKVITAKTALKALEEK
jgi:hypothetical protein